MKILFVDPVCPNPYEVADLDTKRLGGTEATVLRVSRELSKRYKIVIAQRGRVAIHEDSYGVSYTPQNHTEEGSPDVVITLRDARIYRDIEVAYPTSRHYIWFHDVISGPYLEHLQIELRDHKTKALVVSQWHRRNLLNAMASETVKGNLTAEVVYGPLDDYCRPTGVAYDPKKLIFYSSPHKGLDQVLFVFEKLRELDKEFKLYVGNPGYFQDVKELPEGVIMLSDEDRTHQNLMRHIESSLCKLYTQSTFAETFGLVYAEANALGTPVLAHDIGSAREVLDSPKQIINCRDLPLILDTLIRWSKGERPVVSLKREFTIGEVIKTWVKLIQFSR